MNKKSTKIRASAIKCPKKLTGCNLVFYANVALVNFADFLSSPGKQYLAKQGVLLPDGAT